MAAKRKAPQQPLPENWAVSESFQWNGRRIEKGTELTVRGIRGRVRFVKHVQVLEADGGVRREWIDVIDRDKHFRSVVPERVKTVHRIQKTRENHVGK